MKTLLSSILLLASFSFASDPIIAKLDSLRTADSTLIAVNLQAVKVALAEQHAKDSILFTNKIPETLKAQVLAVSKEFEASKAGIDSIKTIDSGKFTAVKVKVDSLRKTWEAKRDSQISKISDAAVQAKIKARIAEIAANHAAVQAKIDARKAALEVKIADLKAKIEAAKTPTTPKTTTAPKN